MRVLITGANGFVGTNLKKKLKNELNYDIFEFNRNSTLEDLSEFIESCDLIFHLAGEVNPKCSDQEFFDSNLGLTKTIIEMISDKNKKIPIIFTSSIHTKLLKNSYGQSKREAELLLEEYAHKLKVPIFIFRLPHLFGKGCKPNHNSVITTWIDSSIKDKELIIYDRNIVMNYLYVEDLIEQFIQIQIDNYSYFINYIEPKETYTITLGCVADLIMKYKLNKSNHSSIKCKEDFEYKLLDTFEYYWNGSD